MKSWIDDHKTLVIAVAAAVGGLILFSILGCIYRCFMRRRNRKLYGYAARPRWNGPRGARSPYGSQGPLFPQQNTGWYQGPGGQPLPPPQPPLAYRQNSERYA